MIEISTDDMERFVDRFSLGRDRGRGSQHFLRVKVLGGVINSEQLRGIAALAEKYDGYAEVTDRQDVQLHWIRSEDAIDVFSTIEKLGFTTDKCGQGFPGPRYGDVRNIVSCPIAGVNRHELINPYPLVKRVGEFFTGNRDYLDLPRKFKISITGCNTSCVKPEVNDLSLIAVRKNSDVGFTVLAGGSVGISMPGPRLARHLKIFVKQEDAFDLIRAFVEVHRDNSSRESKPKARFKWLVENWGMQRLREEIENRLGRKLEDYEGKIPLNGETEHIGVSEQRQDGLFYISIPLLGGVLSANKMMEIARIADEYGTGDVRLTPSQNVIIINVRREDVDAALAELSKAGMPVEGSSLRWTAVACPADFCGKTTGPHPKELASAVVERLERRLGDQLNGRRINLKISGCPNGCGQHLIADIGLMGVPVRAGDGVKQTFDIYVGGRVGPKASIGKLLASRLPAEVAGDAIEKIVSAFVAGGFQDFGEFCDAMGIEQLKSLIFENEKGGEEHGSFK
jgi:sulfite reductase beta subunit-like hemoprotein